MSIRYFISHVILLICCTNSCTFTHVLHVTVKLTLVLRVYNVLQLKGKL